MCSSSTRCCDREGFTRISEDGPRYPSAYAQRSISRRPLEAEQGARRTATPGRAARSTGIRGNVHEPSATCGKRIQETEGSLVEPLSDRRRHADPSPATRARQRAHDCMVALTPIVYGHGAPRRRRAGSGHRSSLCARGRQPRLLADGRDSSPRGSALHTPQDARRSRLSIHAPFVHRALDRAGTQPLLVDRGWPYAHGEATTAPIRCATLRHRRSAIERGSGRDGRPGFRGL